MLIKTKLESKAIINVEGKLGRYTRETYTKDMFKPVTTSTNIYNLNLENYLANKIKNAKDITKVFKNLEKANYTITTVKTIYNENTPCYNTEIGGIFNGNIKVINVIWENINNTSKDGFKQSIIYIIK